MTSMDNDRINLAGKLACKINLYCYRHDCIFLKSFQLMLVMLFMQIFGDEFWSVRFYIGCSLFEISR